MTAPVLFLIFNRPDETAISFAAIRSARPGRLYVAADGPRASKADEAERCERARRIATAVDWPCEVKTLFRPTNLGCRMGVSTGIDWFFEHEEEGIILEDDIVPRPEFFRFATELLELYRHDARVMMVSGCNRTWDLYRAPYSYFFTPYAHIWGWATWRRAWSLYDVTISTWPADKKTLAFRSDVSHNFNWLAFWSRIFDKTYHNRIDTWDYQWMYAMFKHGGYEVTPRSNLIENIGFGGAATHTVGQAPSFLSRADNSSITFPLEHPPEVRSDLAAQKFEEDVVLKVRWKKFLTIPIGIPALLRFWRRKRRHENQTKPPSVRKPLSLL